MPQVSCPRAVVAPAWRPRASGALGAAGLCAGVLALPAAVRADPRFHLRYSALDGCPDEAAFVAEVQRRTPAARVDSTGQRAPTYDISFRREGDQVRGRLRVEREGGSLFEREVLGDSCAQTAAALAFIAAVSLDPNEPPSGAPNASSGALAPPPPPLSSPPSPPSPSHGATRGRFAAGAELATSGAISPGLAWGGSLFLDAGLVRAGLQPSLRLVGTAVATGALEASRPAGGKASFRLLAARLEACPVAIDLLPLRFVPCVGYEIGSLYARGEGVDQPRGGGRLWSALHAGGRVQAQLGARWFVEIGGRLIAPFTARTFVFESPPAPPSAFFSLPRLGASGELGIGVAFP